MRQFTKVLTVFIAVLTLVYFAEAQESKAPQLIVKSREEDKQLVTDGKNFFYVLKSENNINLPIESNTTIELQLSRDLTTKKLSTTDIQTLYLVSLREVFGKYAKYIEAGNMIAIDFKGNSAGYLKRASFEVDLRSAVVTLSGYTKLGSKDGYDVLLKPGIYRLYLSGVLQNFQLAGMFNQNLPLNQESQKVKNSVFGKGTNSNLCEEKLNPIGQLNLTPFPFYLICGFGKIIAIGIKRPDWNLPTGTLLTFYVDRITATRLQDIPTETGNLTR